MDKKSSVIIRIAAWSVTAAVLTAILVLGLCGKNIIRATPFSNFAIGKNIGNSYSDAQHYTAGNGTAAQNNVSQIEVNWVDGAIAITPWTGDEITFSETSSKELSEEEQLHYYVKNGCLIIQYKASGKNPFSRGSKNKNLELKIPETLAANLEKLEVDTVSSEINVTGLTAKEVEMSSASGDIILSDVEAEELEVDTVSGNLNGSSIAAHKKISMDTTSGEAIMNGSFSEIEFDSVSGDLNVDSAICPQKFESDTTSGAVTLIIPDATGFSYQSDSAGGQMNCEFPVIQKENGGTYKDGNASFKFNSVSGDMNIKKK